MKRALLLNLLIFSLSFSAQVKIKAYVDKNTIYEDEVFDFTVELEGANYFPEINLPRSNDYVVISGPSQSSQIQIINGKVSSYKSVTWRLAPTKIGEITIKPITIKIGRRAYSTNKVTVKVLARSGTAKKPADKSQQQLTESMTVFLKAIPSKEEAYIGEEVNVSFVLYFRTSIRTFSRDKLPDARGFWAEAFPASNNPEIESEIIEGVRYKKAELQRIAYFPTISGELTIDPMVISCEVVVPRKRSGSIFDDFFNDPFFDSPFFTQTKVISVSSKPIKINVKPLPEAGKPADFSGAVGKFKIYSMVDSNIMKQNQAVTLRYIVEGIGNINLVKLNPPNLPDYVDIFEPKVERSTDNSGDGIRGRVVYEYVLIPRAGKDFYIPSIKLHYFNPVTKKYEVTESMSHWVKVVPTSGVLTDSYASMSKDEVMLLSEDIRFIYTGNIHLKRVGESFIKSLWFWLILGISIFNITISYGLKYYKINIFKNEKVLRRRKVLQVAKKRLEEIKTKLETGTEKLIATELYMVIARFVSDRLLLENRIPDIEVILNAINGRLREEDVKTVIELLSQLNEMRFSPISLGKNIRELVNETERVLTLLSETI